MQNVKNYLRQARHIEHEIKSLSRLRQANYELACKCTARYENSGTGNSSHDNSIENIMVKIAELDNKINQTVDNLIDTKKEILAFICTLHNSELETILINRYLNFYSIEKIAELMNYSEPTVKRKIRQSIEKLES